jgi:hypothetical protein
MSVGLSRTVVTLSALYKGICFELQDAGRSNDGPVTAVACLNFAVAPIQEACRTHVSALLAMMSPDTSRF